MYNRFVNGFETCQVFLIVITKRKILYLLVCVSQWLVLVEFDVYISIQMAAIVTRLLSTDRYSALIDLISN